MSPDLDRVALRAAGTHWNRSLPHADRVDAAWSAAAEALCTDGAATDDVLQRAARDGITAAADAARRFYGLSQASGYTETSAGFAKYWGQAVKDDRNPDGDFQFYDRVPGATWHQPPLSGWEDAVVERIALGQVWAAISPADRRVLRALAGSGGDYRAAAVSAGMTYSAYRAKLGRARAAFRALWHEGETPSRYQGRGRARDTVTHCPAEHEYTPENTLWWRDGRQVKRRCRKCEAARVAGRQAAA